MPPVPNPVNELYLVNQYGEQLICEVKSASADGAATILGSAAPATVTGKLLTGLGAGSDTAIAATDTILEALAKLQAQITAL